MTIKNLGPTLEAMQKAAMPDAFNMDFLKDMGITSSNDRPVIKLLKFLGFLDSANRPQTPYREFMDHTKAKTVLAARVAGTSGGMTAEAPSPRWMLLDVPFLSRKSHVYGFGRNKNEHRRNLDAPRMIHRPEFDDDDGPIRHFLHHLSSTFWLSRAES
ncbi:MAG: DUF5343 domain-containing protein [Terracidiphilus sp.]